jgi:choline dehydrogenase-like flavoprotein
VSRVHYRASPARTAANSEFLVDRAIRLAKAAGATTTLRTSWPPVLAHIHSTLRIGARIRDSLLDEYAESHAVRGLFVADNFALPNSLGGANPTLTTRALATRSAKRIVRRYFNGSAWVGKVEPVSSIAPAVTAAVAAAPRGG